MGSVLSEIEISKVGYAKVKANYLASPPFTVAYAIAGHLDFDFSSDPLGRIGRLKPVYLKDIWPSDQKSST